MENSVVERYDRWICNEAWHFIRKYGIHEDAEDYIQIARLAAWKYCKSKGITAENLGALTMACIRTECFHSLWAAFCKRHGVGVNKNTYKAAGVSVIPSGIDVPSGYDATYKDDDNTLLISLKGMVNDEWGQILQEIADGYPFKDVAASHGLSVQLLQYYLHQLGDVITEYKQKVPKKMRRTVA